MDRERTLGLSERRSEHLRTVLDRHILRLHVLHVLLDRHLVRGRVHLGKRVQLDLLQRGAVARILEGFEARRAALFPNTGAVASWRLCEVFLARGVGALGRLLLRLVLLQVAAHEGLVAHLDHVVRSAFDVGSDVSPATLVAGVTVHELQVLGRGPRTHVDGGVQVLAPALLALLRVAAFHKLRNSAPGVAAMHVDGGTQLVILLTCPSSLGQARAQRLAPALVALHEVTGPDQSSNAFPVLAAEGLDGLDKARVFLF